MLVFVLRANFLSISLKPIRDHDRKYRTKDKSVSKKHSTSSSHHKHHHNSSTASSTNEVELNVNFQKCFDISMAALALSPRGSTAGLDQYVESITPSTSDLKAPSATSMDDQEKKKRGRSISTFSQIGGLKQRPTGPLPPIPPQKQENSYS